ncbi:hypothetical protein PtrSN002B_003503 [Pyrenophora tritici-repentis]|nr:uncharacterized protein PTRG_04826 [Pyrenophora tritici-repentis Pt-1C-BFP]KAA8612396.1 hypothetical protein PtrV1_12965 [Pyrenophora tritici-repentis]EDU47733.1 predicted protein [Pyrenophora tritici-repentis Pt-1C-BFP]KAG9382858.1 hypothetical protein A1F94_006779 [Pyrenophora tritici-repentis]KAI0580819.1 hypothetical protein Alg215_05008 [Pyrenophora tritici-repentis]KAI0582502.1 hypothetical protein Alg130_06114 [Pyrenophora tritici-repentis]
MDAATIQKFRDRWYKDMVGLSTYLNIDGVAVSDDADRYEIFTIALRSYQELKKRKDIESPLAKKLMEFTIVSSIYFTIATYNIPELDRLFSELRRIHHHQAPPEGTSNIHDYNEPRSTASVQNQNPEPDEYAEDSDNMYAKYDNNDSSQSRVAIAPGDEDSDSDLLDEPIDDDDSDYQLEATYRRKCSYKKHKEYSSKGKAMISWLEKVIGEGEDLSIQELKGDWHLYSTDYLKFQQKMCGHPNEVKFNRGKLSITHHDEKHGTGYDGFLGQMTFYGMPDGYVWNVSGYTPSSVSPHSRLHLAEASINGKRTGATIMLKITFCGNGYMTTTSPAKAVNGAEVGDFTFTGVFSEKTKIEKEDEWAKKKGKWIDCGQYYDWDAPDRGPFRSATHNNKTCYDEDCEGHIDGDRTPMTHSKRSRMPRIRPKKGEIDTDSEESYYSDTEAHYPFHAWDMDY